MTRRLWLHLACAAALAAPCLRAQDTFRVDVRLVRLLSTVKDANGALISSLSKEDFHITDNGIPQDVAVFERESSQPLSVALLLDTSASTGIELKYEVESVRRFLHAVFSQGNPNDAVAFYTFNWEVTLQSNFTRRMARLEQVLKGIRPEGGTSMYDALYLASDSLEPRDGRHVLVIITDGGDTTSSKKFRDALEAAHAADAVIYSILVIPIAADPGRNVGGENALETLSQQTGGRVFAPSVGPALDQAFNEILSDLRTQYLLGYYPKNVPRTKERFHRLEVKVSRPGYRVQTRLGYFGDAGDDSPTDRGPGFVKPKH